MIVPSVIAPIDTYRGNSDITLNIQAEPGDVLLQKTIRFLGPNPNQTN